MIPTPTYGTPANVPGQQNVFDPNIGKPLAGAGAFNPNTGAVITPNSLQPQSPIQLPPPPNYTNPSGAVANGTAVLGANTSTLSPSTTSSTTGDLFTNYLKSLPPPPSSSDIYSNDYAGSGIDSAQNDLNTKNAAVKAAQSRLSATNAQIAGLNAQGQAMNLQQEGRQAPTFAISGQEAENNRQTAIKAIPLQVQALAQQADVASAQGDATLSASILEQAKSHLDTLFQIHSADAKANYDYQNNLISSIYNFADKQQQAQLDEIKTQKAQDFTSQQNSLKDARTLALTAITNGATGVGSKILALDPKSPTYSQDVAKLAAQVPQSPQNLKIQQELNAGGTTTSITTPKGNITVPTTLSPYIQTSYDGTTYADLSSLTPSDKAAYAQQASAAGIKPILDAATAGKINAISVSKENLANISDSLTSQNILNDTQSPVRQGLSNSVSSFLGNADVKSFNAWRTAVINNVQALAGGQGSGLRINQAEIDAALKNDLPVITGVNADNLSTAKAKIEKLNSQLNTWSKQLLGGGNTASTHIPPVGTIVQSGGKQYHVVNAQGDLEPL